MSNRLCPTFEKIFCGVKVRRWVQNNYWIYLVEMKWASTRQSSEKAFVKAKGYVCCQNKLQDLASPFVQINNKLICLLVPLRLLLVKCYDNKMVKLPE